MMQDSRYRIQDTGYKIQAAGYKDKNHLSCIVHRASCIVVFILLILAGCKAKEAPKETTPSQPVEVAPSAETKAPQTAAAPDTGGIKLNQPPIVTSVDVTPNFPKPGDTLKITTTAKDPDGDEISYIYQWLKNDELLPEETTAALSLKGFQRGDRIILNVFPFDGKEKGSPGAMKVTVGNISPEITSSPSESRFENRRFTYQVKATDSENDALTYSLKAAPSGMTIDKTTGLIQWSVPPDFRGKASVTVSVTDNQGGEGLQSFAYEITAEK